MLLSIYLQNLFASVILNKMYTWSCHITVKFLSLCYTPQNAVCLRYILPTNYCKLLHVTHTVCAACVTPSHVRCVRACVTYAHHVRHLLWEHKYRVYFTWWQYIILCLLHHPTETTIHLSYTTYINHWHHHPHLIPHPPDTTIHPSYTTHLTPPSTPHRPPT